MFKIKMKRNFKFEKIKKNLMITKGANPWHNTYEYKTITDSSFLNFAIITAEKYNSSICSYTTESRLVSDIGCLSIYGTKSDFYAIVSELLEQFNDYITICQI